MLGRTLVSSEPPVQPPSVIPSVPPFQAVVVENLDSSTRTDPQLLSLPRTPVSRAIGHLHQILPPLPLTSCLLVLVSTVLLFLLLLVLFTRLRLHGE